MSQRKDNRRVRNSYQKAFAARIKKEVAPFLTVYAGDYDRADDKIDADEIERIERFADGLCTDPRMQPAWPLLHKLETDTLYALIEELYCVTATIGWRSELAPTYKTQRDAIAGVLEAIESFAKLSKSVNIALPLRDLTVTIADYFPELLEQLEQVKMFVLSQAETVAKNEREDIGHLSRKYGGGRHDAIQSMARIIHGYLGKPHYAAVAALANVLLNTGARDEIGPDAVRKAVRRRKPDHSV